jgi:hypothetical protein
MMAPANGNIAKISLIFSLVGVAAAAARLGLPDPLEKRALTTKSLPAIRRPLALFGVFLCLGWLFLPQQPWKHMSSTLLYDVVGSISSAVVARSLRELTRDCAAPTGAVRPLGALLYNPTDDPYYISNLDQDVEPFIAAALEGTEFTNIVHIVLESVRADSYPFQEDGFLSQHVQSKTPVIDNATITTESITPFIASLADHTLVWNNSWSICPLTHKAMLACNTPITC